MKNIFFIALNTILFFGFYSEVSAARLYFNPPNVEAGIKIPLETTLMIDTEGKILNAIEIELDIPKDMYVQNIIHGSSIITLWVEKPIYKDGKIRLAGIIPGGFKGVLKPGTLGLYDPGEILTLILYSESKEIKEINISKKTLLLNDGLGTEISASLNKFEYYFKEGYQPEINNIIDTIPPDNFVVKVVSDDIFDDPYTLIFNTRDGQSGINYYEVKIGNDNWKRAESPYGISRLDFLKNIEVKAVDNFGNVRIVSVDTDFVEGKDKLSLWTEYFIAIISLLVGLYLLKKIIRRFK